MEINDIVDSDVYNVEYENSGKTTMCGWWLKKMIDYCDEPGSRIVSWSKA